MGKQPMNMGRRLYGEGGYQTTLLPFQAAVHKQIQESKRAIAAAKAEKQFNRGLWDEHVFEAQQSYYLAQQRLRESVEAKLGELEAKYKAGRNPAEELLALERTRMKLEAMDGPQISQEISRYMDNPGDYAPVECEALLAAAAKKDPPNVQTLRAKMNAVKYDEPWRQLPAAKPLIQLHDLLSAKFGQARVIGELGVEDVRITDLFEGEPADLPEGEAK